jgi:hypothetical protein
MVTTIDQIISHIPPNAETIKRTNFDSNMYEWRWRFFLINNKKYVEISSLKNNVRKYYTCEGPVYNAFVSSDFDKYVTTILYCYVY